MGHGLVVNRGVCCYTHDLGVGSKPALDIRFGDYEVQCMRVHKELAVD